MPQSEPVAPVVLDPVNRGPILNTLITAYIAYDPATGTPILVKTGLASGPQVTVLRCPEALLAHFSEQTLRLFKQHRRQQPHGHPEQMLETALLTARMAMEGEFADE